MSRQWVEEPAKEIYYVQVGDKAFYGPYVSMQGADQRVTQILKRLDGRAPLPPGWWTDKGPVFLSAPLKGLEEVFAMQLDLSHRKPKKEEEK